MASFAYAVSTMHLIHLVGGNIKVINNSAGSGPTKN
jgi:hypothetical protein